MNLIRFIVLLFVFVGVLASCTVAIALLVLALRFWPVLLVGALALALFSWLLRRAGIHITSRR
ncbi:hypothetical protein HW090_17530 [Pseudomonas sp. ABC1]|uniref:hypothetical protein n=1 Tax=Pseudomonas sp. ABC1 TaxID=2748080 RepID=UPI0015C2F4F1|nr:hypothetical protein [Pseudomonas sp. ABC1]QLF94886.1 hypothetical protein HW090_17530 [Pseudomonas sp. ABC1]